MPVITFYRIIDRQKLFQQNMSFIIFFQNSWPTETFSLKCAGHVVFLFLLTNYRSCRQCEFYFLLSNISVSNSPVLSIKTRSVIYLSKFSYYGMHNKRNDRAQKAGAWWPNIANLNHQRNFKLNLNFIISSLWKTMLN